MIASFSPPLPAYRGGGRSYVAVLAVMTHVDDGEVAGFTSFLVFDPSAAGTKVRWIPVDEITFDVALVG